MLPAVFHAIITPIFRWPYRLVRAPLRIVLIAAGVRKRRAYNLPVAGLQESNAQSITFTLRRAATTPQEEGIAREWLLAWQLAQVATSRLLHELDEVQANLLFWNRRMQRGSHFWFMLLQQGPLGFYHRVRQLLAGVTHGEGGEQAVPFLTETEMVEKRALIFRLLRTALCEALARVQAAGALLYMKGPLSPLGPSSDQQALLPGAGQPGSTGGRSPGTGTGMGAGAGSDAELVVVGAEEGAGSGGNGGDEESLFERAERAIQVAMEEIVQAFAQLQTSAHAALDVPGAQPLMLAEEARGREAGLLSQTVQKVLGLHHLRRLFSREQLGAGQGAAGTAGAAGLPAARESEGTEGTEGTDGAEGQSQLRAVAPASLGSTGGALRRARRAVGLVGAHVGALPPLGPRDGVHAARGGAAAAGRRLRRERVVSLPRWLLMPSELQQHWIRYTLVGVGLGYASIFIYKHTRLSGSRDMENWIKRGTESVQSAVKLHVARPLRQVKDELFDTFRRRPTIVSMKEFEADRDSLQRMLDDFRADVTRRRGGALPLPPPSPSSNGAAEPAAGGEGAGGAPAAELVPAGSEPAAELVPSPGLEGMELVMRCYEEELKRPLRNLVNGELARSLLIQVQKMKVDTESAMLEMDQILRANELSISLVAAVPAFLIAGGALYSLGRWLTPTPPDPRWEAVPCRLALVDVMRAVEGLRACEEGEGTDGEEEAQGWFFYCLAVGYEEAAELFRRHRGLLLGGGGRSEWPALREDLTKLAAPAPAHQRQRVLERVMRSYSVFQQF